MLKYLFMPAIICMLFACNQPYVNKTLADSLHTTDTSLKTISAERMIIGGKSIGAIYIDENADSVIAKLGKPVYSDAAMGASLMTWIAKHGKATYQTTIYTHKNMGGSDEMINHIKEIKVTSPFFKTADYAGAGSELKDVRKLYKFKVRALSGRKKLSLYDDCGAGIGFEVDSTGRCIAVLVHAKGDSTATYLSMQ